MRARELRLVVTFHTTAEAMAMEKAAQKVGLEGRIIPVPRSISAGCGLSWCSPVERREEVIAVMEQAHIEEDELHEIMV